MSETNANKRIGKIITIVILAVMILPACYALFKELRYKDADKARAAGQAPVVPGTK